MNGDTQSGSLSSAESDGNVTSCDIDDRLTGLTRMRRFEVEVEGLLGEVTSSEFMNQVDRGVEQAATRMDIFN